MAFTSIAEVAIDQPLLELDLSPSNPIVYGGSVMTWTMTAHNRGTDWPAGRIVSLLPFDQLAIDNAVTASIGAATHQSGTVTWQGELLSGQSSH